MAELKDVHDKLDEIPEEFQELYTEKGGKYELTGIKGVKTQADVTRVQKGADKERDAHKETKAKLKVWEGMDHAEVTEKLDKIPDLEAAAKGKLDEAQIEEIVTRRVDGTIRSKLAPLERENKQLKETNVGLVEENGKHEADNTTRKIHDHVRKSLVKSKVIPDAHDDALMLADRVMEVREDDGAVVTKADVGVTPGLDGDGWLAEIEPRKRHWWPESVGGGSKGSGGGAGGLGGQNPWSNEHWNMTKQAAYHTEHGPERAAAMAKAAGTKVGGGQPPAKKAAAV